MSAVSCPVVAGRMSQNYGKFRSEKIPRGALILIDSRSYLMEHLTVYVYGEQSEKFRTSHWRFATSGNDRFKYINNHYLKHFPLRHLSFDIF